MHLETRLTRAKRMKTKRRELDLKLGKMYWLIGRKSQLSFYDKLSICKDILKPVLTCGMQITKDLPVIDILQWFRYKALGSMLDAPWYVTNATIRKDLELPTTEEEIQRYSINYEERKHIVKCVVL